MNDMILSIDVDWAPDFMIEQSLNILLEHDAKATWFITHETDMIEEIRKYPNFELAIHPNFLPNSSQGKNYNEVIKSLLKIVPEAKTVRPHALFYHHYLSKIYIDCGLLFDSGIYLKEVPNIIPFEITINDKKLVKIPFFWAEDSNIKEDSVLFLRPGLKIFVFHPVHIFLNSNNIDNYNRLKNECDIIKCSFKQAEKYINNSNGSRNMIDIISKYCNKTIKQIGEEFLSQDEHN